MAHRPLRIDRAAPSLACVVSFALLAREEKVLKGREGVRKEEAVATRAAPLRARVAVRTMMLSLSRGLRRSLNRCSVCGQRGRSDLGDELLCTRCQQSEPAQPAIAQQEAKSRQMGNKWCWFHLTPVVTSKGLDAGRYARLACNGPFLRLCGVETKNRMPILRRCTRGLPGFLNASQYTGTLPKCPRFS